MTPLHYHTNNTAQAQALQMCGAELIDIWNVYTPETIRKLGYSTAREAWKNEKPGAISYFFKQTPELPRLIQIWDETQEQIKKGENLTVDPNPEDVMRITCAALKLRSNFASLWKGVTPKVQLPNPGEPRTEKVGDEVRVKMPGFRLVSINASKETKERLKF